MPWPVRAFLLNSLAAAQVFAALWQLDRPEVIAYGCKYLMDVEWALLPAFSSAAPPDKYAP